MHNIFKFYDKAWSQYLALGVMRKLIYVSGTKQSEFETSKQVIESIVTVKKNKSIVE